MSASWPAVALMSGVGLGVGVLLDVVGDRERRRECHHFTTRFPVSEASTAVLFGAVTVRFGLSAQLPAYLYLAAVGGALVVLDFDLRRLPDSVVLPSYIVTVVLLMPAGAVAADWYTGVRALAGMLALLALYFALALAYPNGLALGDVKLAGLVGLYLGWLSWNALFVTALGSLLIACIGGGTAVLARPGNRAIAVPIAPCLLSAAVLALFIATPISNWYGSLLPA
jgi:leader peptidase (prepilin peptidase)/N-methyltransferase